MDLEDSPTRRKAVETPHLLSMRTYHILMSGGLKKKHENSILFFSRPVSTEKNYTHQLRAWLQQVDHCFHSWVPRDVSITPCFFVEISTTLAIWDKWNHIGLLKSYISSFGCFSPFFNAFCHTKAAKNMFWSESNTSFLGSYLIAAVAIFVGGCSAEDLDRSPIPICLPSTTALFSHLPEAESGHHSKWGPEKNKKTTEPRIW